MFTHVAMNRGQLEFHHHYCSPFTHIEMATFFL